NHWALLYAYQRVSRACAGENQPPCGGVPARKLRRSCVRKNSAGRENTGYFLQTMYIQDSIRGSSGRKHSDSPHTKSARPSRVKTQPTPSWASSTRLLIRLPVATMLSAS